MGVGRKPQANRPHHRRHLGVEALHAKPLDAAETLPVALVNAIAHLDDLVPLLKLCAQHGRLHIGEAEVVAHHMVPVLAVRSHPVVANQPHAIGEFGVACEHQPALAAGDRLGRLETERRDIAERSAERAESARKQRLGAIFDQRYPVHAGNRG